MDKYVLECCVDSVESALAAAEGGADRLELCSALVIGGVSPGLALFEQVSARCDLPVRVLLRPRFGDFLYTDYEFQILKREVSLFREAGAEGVVIGCLLEDGGLHMEQMRELIAEAGDMKVTLHRAFDVCADPIKTYRQAGELGIDTVLTSGQKKECLEGMPLLKELCGLQKEAGMPRIMAGAGVTPDVIRQFCAQTDITSYHLSAKKVLDSGMRYRKEGVPMGLPTMDEYSIFRTDSNVVAQAKRVIQEHMPAERRTANGD
ncbi:MAG: copper homeostasis protein CutC [Lachnospiraceae bacterium]|jgi:copper homeostasis protein|nr:copper homeostasis protein CutC [Lachnospiraceae bacterium]